MEVVIKDIGLEILDKICLNDPYTANVVTTVAQCFAKKYALEECSQVKVLSQLDTSFSDLEKLLKKLHNSQDIYQKPCYILLERETNWSSVVVTKNESEADKAVLILYKDFTGGMKNPVEILLQRVFSGGVKFVVNSEGSFPSNDSAALSLKWMQMVGEGLQSPDRNQFITDFPKMSLASKELNMGKLKTNLKVDLVAHKIKRMLTNTRVNQKAKYEIGKFMKSCENGSNKFGKPLSSYEEILNEEMPKLEIDADPKQDTKKISNAQKKLMGELGKMDKTEINFDVSPSQNSMETPRKLSDGENKQRSPDHNIKDNEEKKPLDVFKHCIRLLRETEETEKLRALLNSIEDKFGVSRGKYFPARGYPEASATADLTETSKSPKAKTLRKVASELARQEIFANSHVVEENFYVRLVNNPKEAEFRTENRLAAIHRHDVHHRRNAWVEQTEFDIREQHATLPQPPPDHLDPMQLQLNSALYEGITVVRKIKGKFVKESHDEFVKESPEEYFEVKINTKGDKKFKKGPRFLQWENKNPIFNRQTQTLVAGKLEDVQNSVNSSNSTKVFDTQNHDNLRVGNTAFNQLNLRQESGRISQIERFNAPLAAGVDVNSKPVHYQAHGTFSSIKKGPKNPIPVTTTIFKRNDSGPIHKRTVTPGAFEFERSSALWFDNMTSSTWTSGIVDEPTSVRPTSSPVSVRQMGKAERGTTTGSSGEGGSESVSLPKEPEEEENV